MRKEIQQRLNSFKNLSLKEQFQEFQFCLLTPQSNAQRCWLAVQELSTLNNPSLKKITKILSTKTRFHNVKAKRIINAKETFNEILPHLSNNKTKELRNFLAENINGYGLKEASHFLRNIGKSNNEIAILDRHILKNLASLKIIKDNKIKNKNHYLEIEQLFLTHANSINIPADELDLLWWSKENGQLFK